MVQTARQEILSPEERKETRAAHTTTFKWYKNHYTFMAGELLKLKGGGPVALSVFKDNLLVKFSKGILQGILRAGCDF